MGDLRQFILDTLNYNRYDLGEEQTLSLANSWREKGILTEEDIADIQGWEFVHPVIEVSEEDMAEFEEQYSDIDNEVSV